MTTGIKFEGPWEILRKKISIFWILWLLVFQLYSNVYCNRKSLSDNIRQRNIMKPSILEKIACQQTFMPEYHMTGSHDWVTWPNSSKNSLDFFLPSWFFLVWIFYLDENTLPTWLYLISNVHITLVRIGKYLGPVRITNVRSNFRIVMLPPLIRKT